VNVCVEQAGIDTWSPAWYVRPEGRCARALGELATQKVPRGYVLPEKIAGHTVGWFPGTSMVFAEGHPGGDRLGRGDELPSVLVGLEEAMFDYGIDVVSNSYPLSRSAWAGLPTPQRSVRLPGFAGVRRLDSTVDLRFGRGAEGLAALAGVAAVGLTRSKPAVYFERPGGPVQSVYMLSLGRRAQVLGRWYDKGVESGLARRGELIRPEDQRRFNANTRRAVEELSTAQVRQKFHQRFVPLWQATKGVTVAGPNVLAVKLGELVDEGVLTTQMAEKLAGFLLLDSNGVDVGDRTTRWRRRKALRENGLVLPDGVLQEVEVRLDEVLEAALDSSAWGCQG
jgi:hypothetical protein